MKSNELWLDCAEDMYHMSSGSSRTRTVTCSSPNALHLNLYASMVDRLSKGNMIVLDSGRASNHFWSLFAPIVGPIRGEDAVRSRFWSSDGPPFCHLRHDGLKRYDSFWLAGVSHTPTCWDVGSSRVRAIPDLPLQKPGLRHRPARCASPSRGGTCPGARQRSALHRL